MSIWSNLLSWALSAAKTEAQTNGLKDLQAATGALSTVLTNHAPDLAPTLQPILNQVIQGAIAGIMTKTH